MKALNFYSSVYHGFLVSRDKRCTIRLGDKAAKYEAGDIVWVTYGDRYKPRKKLFTAVLDEVVVKPLGELSREELASENPEMKRPEDALEFLARIYKRPVTLESLVTLVHFSEIKE